MDDFLKKYNLYNSSKIKLTELHYVKCNIKIKFDNEKPVYQIIAKKPNIYQIKRERTKGNVKELL